MPKLTQTSKQETSWAEIARNIKEHNSNLEIGDIITEQTAAGETLELVVVDIGNGWARFESRDCLTAAVSYNKHNRSAGGFADSDVKQYLNGVVFNSLPEDLRSVIAEVERKQEGGQSFHCRLFLPTESEMFGNCRYSVDSTYQQIEYYKNQRNRIKCKDGEPDWYWLASVVGGDSTLCVYVGYGGHSNYYNASNELYVPVCFIIQ